MFPFVGGRSDGCFLNICESGGKPIDILRLPGSYSVARLGQSAPVTLWTPECSLKGKHARDSNGCCAFRKQTKINPLLMSMPALK